MSVSQQTRPLRATAATGVLTAHAAARVLEPSASARLLARVFSHRADRALIDGADPSASPVLAARAARLGAARTRSELARALEALVRAAQGPQRRWWALSSPTSVLANSSELHALASLLDSGAPVYARGVAAVNQLLSDGTGPAYQGDATRLARAVGDARSALRA
jgi:hypothetical protein